jgi:light-regulated signal transduction histidine kinase (bacteriophytochrome)
MAPSPPFWPSFDEPGPRPGGDPVYLFGIAAAFGLALGGPVTAIASSFGNSEAALDLPAGARTSTLSAIERSSRSARRMIRALRQGADLLRAARNPGRVDVAALLEAAIGDISGAVPTLSIVTQICRTPTLLADCAHIDRVLRELVSHAARSVDARGPAQVEISALTVASDVRVEIRYRPAADAPQDAPMLFAFPSELSPASPIALGIARALAAANDGRTWAEAEDGAIRLILCVPFLEPASPVGG